MKQKIRTFIRKLLFNLSNILLKFKWYIKLFNLIYNFSPWYIKRIIYNHSNLSKIDYNWKIRLLNGTFIKSKIMKNAPKSINLALLYHNISPQICILENIIDSAIENSNVYIDIGANTGMRSLFALSKKRKVYMFEPNPVLVDIIKNRCIENNFSNYIIEQLCVSDSNTLQEFYFSNDDSMSSLEIEYAKIRGIANSTKVQTITLDSYFKEVKFEKHPYVKIDVEGHELQVIKGARDFILKYEPTLLIEIFEKENKEYIFNFLNEYGYYFYGVVFGSKNIIRKLQNSKDFLNCEASDFLFVKDEHIIKQIKSN